jgi:hypothetical protein
MEERKDEPIEARIFAWLARHWRWLTVVIWLGYCGWFLYSQWIQIRTFGLGDTDDNMRMSQVRALLNGQDWFDLRQYRMNPPVGSNIHWSRLVDLPIAGMILLFRQFVSGAEAERAAVAIAPLLPQLVLLFALGLTARRLIDPRAFFLPFAALFFAGSANGMFMPERIDHHGWQLALLAVSIAGMADPKRLRGGVTVGISTALSLIIGLEMIIYLAVAGAAMALFWITDRNERERLTGYALTLSGGCAIGYLLFASYANRLPVCDALSPVWLSDALLGGALLFGLAWWSPPDWKQRLALATGAGLVIAAFHALMWPHCLTRLEGVSPEVKELWLSHVREARPVYMHGWRVAVAMLTLPVTGAIGWSLLVWRWRRDADLLRRTLAAAAPAIAALLLLFWQVRTGPASQMLATVGAAALLWILVPLAWNSTNRLVAIIGTFLLVLFGVGAAIPLAIDKVVPADKVTSRQQAIGKANRLCNFIGSFHPIALQPKGTVFTFVDLGPRLITVTHHNSITGPYHRNGEQIADVMKAFRGSEPQARAIIAGKYRSDYVLTCPEMSTTTIFQAEAPKGFYGQLTKGQVPAWLQPVPLPADSPFRMWRVIR